MELRTKSAGYYSFLNIKVDEKETDIFENDEDAVNRSASEIWFNIFY